VRPKLPWWPCQLAYAESANVIAMTRAAKRTEKRFMGFLRCETAVEGSWESVPGCITVMTRPILPLRTATGAKPDKIRARFSSSGRASVLPAIFCFASAHRGG
jgi:hypothetical protein